MPKRFQLHMGPASGSMAAAATPNRPTPPSCRPATGTRGSLGHEFIHIAPAPRFTRLDRARHRVLGGMVVLGGVGVGRRVAAPDVAAGEAKAEMDPTAADLQAFFAAA